MEKVSSFQLPNRIHPIPDRIKSSLFASFSRFLHKSKKLSFAVERYSVLKFEVFFVVRLSPPSLLSVFSYEHKWKNVIWKVAKRRLNFDYEEILWQQSNTFFRISWRWLMANDDVIERTEEAWSTHLIELFLLKFIARSSVSFKTILISKFCVQFILPIVFLYQSIPWGRSKGTEIFHRIIVKLIGFEIFFFLLLCEQEIRIVLEFLKSEKYSDDTCVRFQDLMGGEGNVWENSHKFFSAINIAN